MRRDAVGLREVLFQSVTAMAPAAAIAASIPSGAAFAGGALPLSVAAALVGCLFAAVCVGELARQLPAAGSLATYAARGIHPAAGFLVAWGYVFAQALVPVLLLLQLGFTTADTLHERWPGYPAGLWWPWALAGAVVIALAGVRGVRASAWLGTVLGAFELAVFVALAGLLIVKAGAHNTVSVFTTAHTPPGHRGAGGVVAGSVYTVLAFAGFEAAAALAEEARAPRRTVRLAVLGATVAIGAVYLVTSYAMTVYYGPGRMAAFGTSGAASWEGVARSLSGVWWLLVFLAVVNSTLANANAGANVSTRTAFAFGRIGVFPPLLAVVHPRFRSPVAAVAAQFAVSVGVTSALGLRYSPATAFVLVATVIVIVVIGVYLVTGVACAGYFMRRGTPRLRPVPHLVCPLLAIAVFTPALLTAAGLPVFPFVVRTAPPASYAGAVVGGWLLLGVVVLAVVGRRHPDRLAAAGRIHLDEDAAEGERA
nr:APC family permease [Streptomyces sp. SID5468]